MKIKNCWTLVVKTRLLWFYFAWFPYDHYHRCDRCDHWKVFSIWSLWSLRSMNFFFFFSDIDHSDHNDHMETRLYRWRFFSLLLILGKWMIYRFRPSLKSSNKISPKFTSILFCLSIFFSHPINSSSDKRHSKIIYTREFWRLPSSAKTKNCVHQT